LFATFWALMYPSFMSDAISIAELALARALMVLDRQKGGLGEELAQRQVAKAEQHLEAAKASPVGRDQRLCCGRPMLWSDGRWICALGMHDD
jgi:hypothetical protein